MNTIQKVEQKVFSFLEEHHMLLPGDSVIVGVSGGADSVCLLFVLAEWAKRNPLTMGVVHVNHGIRPEAGQDAAYVETLCRRLEIPFFLTEEDVAERAKREGISTEEAGRLVRYEAFQRACEDFGANRIAVAHNSNDRAETMLFHLFRGSGMKGLCGIRPVRDEIIRPLLCLERWEIEAYLAERGISYCQDITNEKDDYTRNRIRHHILPYAEEQVARGVISHMAQTAEGLLETEEYLAEQTEAARKSCVCEQEGRVHISVTDFLEFHKVIQKRLLLTLLCEMTPSHKDIAAVHVNSVLSCFEKEKHRTVCLPMGIRCRRQYGEVVLGMEGENFRDVEPVRDGMEIREKAQVVISRIPPEGQRVTVEGLGTVVFQVLNYEKTQVIPQNQYTKWFDYDKIEKPLVFRTRQTGDFFCIHGKGSSGLSRKSVKSAMIDRKIPRECRDRIPLLAEGEHVLWIAGYRTSEYYHIQTNTKRILQVQLERDCFGSRTEEKDGRTY